MSLGEYPSFRYSALVLGVLFCVAAVTGLMSDTKLTAQVVCTSEGDTSCCWGNEWQECHIEGSGESGVCDYSGGCNPDAILCIDPSDPRAGPTDYVCIKPSKCDVYIEDYGPTSYFSKEECESAIQNPGEEYCAEDFGEWYLYTRDLKFLRCDPNCEDVNNDNVCDSDDEEPGCTVGDDTACDDGIACTTDWCESAGVCRNVADSSLCGDGGKCSTCDVAEGACVPDTEKDSCVYSVCENSNCVEQQGEGEDECSSPDDCTHSVCNTETRTCGWLDGPGENECESSEDCCGDWTFSSTDNTCCEHGLKSDGSCAECASADDCSGANACETDVCTDGTCGKEPDTSLCYADTNPDTCLECVPNPDDSRGYSCERDLDRDECRCPTDFTFCGDEGATPEQKEGLDGTGDPQCCHPEAWCSWKEETSRSDAHWVCATELPDDSDPPSGSSGGDMGDLSTAVGGVGGDDGGGNGDTGDSGDTTTITQTSSAGNSTTSQFSINTSAATSAATSVATSTTTSSVESSADSTAVSSNVSFANSSVSQISTESSFSSSSSSFSSLHLSSFSSGSSELDSFSSASSGFDFSLSSFSAVFSSSEDFVTDSSQISSEVFSTSSASKIIIAISSFSSASAVNSYGDTEDDGQVGNQDDDDDGDGDNENPVIADSQRSEDDGHNTITPTLVASAAACGDGVLEVGEECDDNNRRNNDGCNAECLLEVGICGDGRVQSLLGEQCEQSSHDTSLPYSCVRCQFVSQSCGDGTVDPGEECDDGPQNSTSPDANCRPTCRFGTCGDGILDSSEQCDDANRLSGDGCDRYCTREEAEPTQVAGDTAEPVAIDFPQGPGAINGQQSLQSRPYGIEFPNQANTQGVPYQLPLAQLQPLIQGQAPAGDTGPAAVAVIGAGAAVGFGWMRKRK